MLCRGHIVSQEDQRSNTFSFSSLDTTLLEREGPDPLHPITLSLYISPFHLPRPLNPQGNLS